MENSKSSMTWEEFEHRIDKIFVDIKKLIQETNGNKID